MTLARRLACGGLAVALAAWFLPARVASSEPPRTQAATQAPPPAANATCPANAPQPQLNSDPYQWKAGTSIGVWIDGDGRTARGSHKNPKPEITLSAMEARALFNGINQWGGMPETGVTFSLQRDNPDQTAHYWVTVAWPEADLVFTASSGTVKAVTCTVPQDKRHALAYTCRFEDELDQVSQSHAVRAAITMINTRHTHPDSRGEERVTLLPDFEGWLPALTKLGAHENGHVMGLADTPRSDVDGRSRPHVMKSFNGTNDIAPEGGSPRLAAVTACDRAAILTHQSGQYQR